MDIAINTNSVKHIKLINLALCIVLGLCPFFCSAQIITTYAGTGTVGSAGDSSSALSATFTYLFGIATDSSANVYVCDRSANRIRRISTAGTVYPFAGMNVGGGYGGDGGSATAGYLNSPYSIASDFHGNVYICDQANFRVRKVNTSGIISTFAGNGTSGHTGDGGPATAAEVNNPCGIAVDRWGNVFIGDGTGRVRKVNTSGIISTVAGSDTLGFGGDGGPATLAKLANASSVAVDGRGNLYIADRENNRVRIVDTAGVINTFTGRGTTGSTADGVPATAAYMHAPSCVATDLAGNVYITTDNLLRKINTSGIITTLAGSATAGFGGDGGPCTAATLNLPQSVVVHGSGDIYIGDYFNYRVRKITYNHYPVFTYGPSHSMTVCESSGTISINSLLSMSDPDSGQTLTWRQLFAPTHGTINANFSTTSTGTTIIPSGMDYTPAAGYSGADSFSVLLQDGWLSDTLTIRVNIVPILSLSSITGLGDICIGTPDTLTVSPSGGSWFTGSVAAATVTDGIVSGVAMGSTTITYTISNSCSADTAYFNVNIWNVVTPYVTITGDSNICAGRTVTFTATPVNGGSSPVFQWHKNGVYVGSDSTNFTTAALATGDHFNCTLNSNAHCLSIPRNVSNTISMHVTANITPSVTITGDSTSPLCAGTAVTLVSHPVNGGSAPTIRWRKMGTIIGYLASVTCTPANGDVVTCEMTSNATCPVPATVYDSTTFLVNPPLTPYVTINASTTTAYLGQIVTFTAEETYGGTSPVYQWYVNNVPVPGATNYTYSLEIYSNDTVYCTSISNAPCISGALDTSNVLVVLTGYNEVKGKVTPGVDFTITPNPNNGHFILTGVLNSIPSNGLLEYDISDVEGRVISSTVINVTSNHFSESIFLDEKIATGLYFLRIHDEGADKVFRISLLH